MFRTIYIIALIVIYLLFFTTSCNSYNFTEMSDGNIIVNGTKLKFENEQKLYKKISNEFILKVSSADIFIKNTASDRVEAAVKYYEYADGDAELFFEDHRIESKTKSGKDIYISEVHLRIPYNIDFEVSCGSGDIEAEEMKDMRNIELETGSGDFYLGNLDSNKQITLETGSGDIEIVDGNDNERMLFSTGSGDISLDRINKVRFVKIGTGSGDIDINDCAFLKFNFTVGSGDVELNNSEIQYLDYSIGNGDLENNNTTIYSREK